MLYSTAAMLNCLKNVTPFELRLRDRLENTVAQILCSVVDQNTSSVSNRQAVYLSLCVAKN